MEFAELKNLVNERTWGTLSRAFENSSKLVEAVKSDTAKFLEGRGFPKSEVCLIAVGSVGRLEALEASDLDLIPVLKTSSGAARFKEIDAEIRRFLSDKTKLKVSAGQDLTRLISLTELTDPDSIGGDADCSSSLTRRMLILTEAVQVGGEFSLNEIREALLAAYADADRTSGRHVLSLCNDVARYYRMLCIEYKAKVDTQAKDWCTRNIKLRHSRKFWYFATMISIVSVAEEYPDGSLGYQADLCKALGQIPSIRLVRALDGECPAMVASILQRYATFLEFMSDQGRRDALSKVNHTDRYACNLQNPFPGMKANSELLHKDMLKLIDAMPVGVQDRIFDWFFL